MGVTAFNKPSSVLQYTPIPFQNIAFVGDKARAASNAAAAQNVENSAFNVETLAQDDEANRQAMGAINERMEALTDLQKESSYAALKESKSIAAAQKAYMNTGPGYYYAQSKKAFDEDMTAIDASNLTAQEKQNRKDIKVEEFRQRGGTAPTKYGGFNTYEGSATASIKNSIANQAVAFGNSVKANKTASGLFVVPEEYRGYLTSSTKTEVNEEELREMTKKYIAGQPENMDYLRQKYKDELTLQGFQSGHLLDGKPMDLSEAVEYKLDKHIDDAIEGGVQANSYKQVTKSFTKDIQAQAAEKRKANSDAAKARLNNNTFFGQALTGTSTNSVTADNIPELSGSIGTLANDVKALQSYVDNAEDPNSAEVKETRKQLIQAKSSLANQIGIYTNVNNNTRSKINELGSEKPAYLEYLNIKDSASQGLAGLDPNNYKDKKEYITASENEIIKQQLINNFGYDKNQLEQEIGSFTQVTGGPDGKQIVNANNQNIGRHLWAKLQQAKGVVGGGDLGKIKGFINKSEKEYLESNPAIGRNATTFDGEDKGPTASEAGRVRSRATANFNQHAFGWGMVVNGVSQPITGEDGFLTETMEKYPGAKRNVVMTDEVDGNDNPIYSLTINDKDGVPVGQYNLTNPNGGQADRNRILNELLSSSDPDAIAKGQNMRAIKNVGNQVRSVNLHTMNQGDSRRLPFVSLDGETLFLNKVAGDNPTNSEYEVRVGSKDGESLLQNAEGKTLVAGGERQLLRYIDKSFGGKAPELPDVKKKVKTEIPTTDKEIEEQIDKEDPILPTDVKTGIKKEVKESNKPANQVVKEWDPLMPLDGTLPTVKNTEPEAVEKAVTENPVLSNMDDVENIASNPIEYLVDNGFIGIREEDITNEKVKTINKVFKSLVPDYDKKYDNLTSNGKAWCGALVYEVLSNMGVMPTDIDPNSEDAYNTIRAKEYLNVGKAVDTPRYGDLVVVSNNGQSHVAFYAGEEGDSLVLLGGNQGYEIRDNQGNTTDKTGGELNFKTFPKDKEGFKIEGYRRLKNMSDIKEATMVKYKKDHGVIDIENFQTR